MGTGGAPSLIAVPVLLWATITAVARLIHFGQCPNSATMNSYLA